MNSMIEGPETMVREALRLDREGRSAEAIAAYQRVLARWPQLADCWYQLAALQRRAMQYESALASYQRALDQRVRQPEEVHLNRGVIYADDLRRYEAAERELLAALELNPDYVPALMNLANLHEDLGRRNQAIEAYERILALDARHAEALARYANLKSFERPGDPLIERMKREIAQPETMAPERASLGFALGRALDSCGAYAAANRDSRNSAPPGAAHYDRSAHERFIDRLITVFGVRPPPCAPAPAAPRPIFVCGMFRSGSTLTEQMLAGHPRITAGGEIDFLPRIAQGLGASFPEAVPALTPARLQTLAARYLDRLAELFPGAEYVVDKRPDNFLYIGLIKALFPDAKIVHTTRDALDNCLSIYFLHLDPRMSYALDLMDIGHYYREYLRLMAHWKAMFGADIVDFNYDEFVRAPQPAAERLLSSLGLEWDDRCLGPVPEGRAVKTASVWQVREPVYQRSSGRARHYAGQLDALRAYLTARR